MPAGMGRFSALHVSVLVAACARSPAPSPAVSPAGGVVPVAEKPSAPTSSASAATAASAPSDSAPPSAATGEPVAAPSATVVTTGNDATAFGCLPYGETVVLRGIVARPASTPESPASPAPKQKSQKGALPKNAAWQFHLDSKECIVDQTPAKKGSKLPVATMLLMPIGGVKDSYRTFEGRLVDATGVLVGIASGDQMHLLFVVREINPVAAAKAD